MTVAFSSQEFAAILSLCNLTILFFANILHKYLFVFHCRSLLPDVVDDFRLKNPFIKGLEPIFCSFYVFFTKFAAGVSLGFSTLSLE